MAINTTEKATRWLPVSDIPDFACQTWRLRTDSDFGLRAEGDFLVSQRTRTLALEFDYALAFAAHEDMGGCSMFHTDDLPLIENGPQKGYRWPLLRIENSIWLKSLIVVDDATAHYALLSLTCTVEVAAPKVSARWL